jgi:hypothetical protein
MSSDLSTGSLVRLHGLKRSELNHHVGQVVKEVGIEGRIGVSLHNAIFSCGEFAAAPFWLSVTRENLRKIERPAPGTASSVRGTISSTLIVRMFGEAGFGLPDDVAVRIAGSLSLCTLTSSEVRVQGCSSSRGDFPASVALNSKEDEWWISAAGSMAGGVGSEYLEFAFGGLRRISYVALKIPPLPYGPLSVRKFHIMALRYGKGAQRSESDAWATVDNHHFQTLDLAGLQEFALVPPCDCEALRLVFTLNAAGAEGGGVSGFGTDCVGLFQVALA